MGTTNQQVDWLVQTDVMAKKWNDKGYFSREQPQHTVTLASYHISKYPVTVREYRAFVRAGGYQVYRYWTEAGWMWRESVGRIQPEFWGD